MGGGGRGQGKPGRLKDEDNWPAAPRAASRERETAASPSAARGEGLGWEWGEAQGAGCTWGRRRHRGRWAALEGAGQSWGGGRWRRRTVWGAGAGSGAPGGPGGAQSVGRCTQRPLLHPLSAHSASTPETWARFTQENLQRAERERLASFNLRGLIDCILRDTAEDLRLQCDSVNLAFGRRLEELEDARHKLEHHLNKVHPLRPSHSQARPGQVQTCPRV